MGFQLQLWEWVRPLARAIGLYPPAGSKLAELRGTQGKNGANEVSAVGDKRGARKRTRAGKRDGADQMARGGEIAGEPTKSGSGAQADPFAGVRPAELSTISPSSRDSSRSKRAAGGGAVKGAKAPGRRTRQESYDFITKAMLAKYNIRVRKWRKSMSGVATLVRYPDGRTAKYLESPRPRSPMSMAIFLHEVGHHAIGLGIHKPRCLEEYLAWKFSMEAMAANGVDITQRVERRMQRSLEYAVGKAVRRGIKSIPAQVMAYHQVTLNAHLPPPAQKGTGRARD